ELRRQEGRRLPHVEDVDGRSERSRELDGVVERSLGAIGEVDGNEDSLHGDLDRPLPIPSTMHQRAAFATPGGRRLALPARGALRRAELHSETALVPAPHPPGERGDARKSAAREQEGSLRRTTAGAAHRDDRSVLREVRGGDAERGERN